MEAAVEALPAELDGIATEVLIQFPWGSLLRGVAAGDDVVLGNLRRICSPYAQLQITIGLDPLRDRFEWERLELPAISVDYIKTVLAPRYRSAGFKIVKAEQVSWSELSHLQTSWAKRLHQSDSRKFFRIVSVAER